MRELLEKGRNITIVPSDYKNANKGVISEVSSDGFVVDLDYDPEGMLRHNYCEFYTQNQYGSLFFTSYPESIDGKTLKIANPSKHKYLQRRQYTRVKYNYKLELKNENFSYNIDTLDISAGGMKFTCDKAVNLESLYTVSLPISSLCNVECSFAPIRIEKNSKNYIVSGQFVFKEGKDRMMLTQFCAKRSIEIRNK